MAEELEMTWWQREHLYMVTAYDAKPGPKRILITRDMPLPKLSDFLRCAYLAKAEPEIWEGAKQQALVPQAHWDDDELRPRSFMPLFTAWYQFKFGLQDHYPNVFGLVQPTLMDWAHPDYDGDELAIIHKFGNPDDYIDDLTGTNGQIGDAP